MGKKVYDVLCYMEENNKKEKPYLSDVVTANNKKEVEILINKKNINHNRRARNKNVPKRIVCLHSIKINKRITNDLKRMGRLN